MASPLAEIRRTAGPMGPTFGKISNVFAVVALIVTGSFAAACGSSNNRPYQDGVNAGHAANYKTRVNGRAEA